MDQPGPTNDRLLLLVGNVSKKIMSNGRNTPPYPICYGGCAYCQLVTTRGDEGDRFGVILRRRAGDTDFVPGASPVVVPRPSWPVSPKTYRPSHPVPPTSHGRIATRTPLGTGRHLRLNSFHRLVGRAAGKPNSSRCTARSDHPRFNSARMCCSMSSSCC